MPSNDPAATAELVAQVHQAMSEAGGDRRKAAKAMGWRKDRFHYFIKNNPNLHASWAGSEDHFKRPARRPDVPTDIEALSRECAVPPPETMGASETDLAVAMIDENAKLKNGLDSIGLSPREREYAAALTDFDKNFFSDTVHMASAGSARMSILMQGLFGELHARFSEVSKNIREHRPVANGNPADGPASQAAALPDEQRDRMVDEERSLVNQLVQVSEQVRRISELFYKGALVRAAISGKNKPVEKRMKAGFVNIPREGGNGG